MTELTERVQELENRLAAMEPALRSAQASQSVHEFLIVHTIGHLCSMTKNREASIAAIMLGVETSMLAQAEIAREKLGPRANKAIQITLNYLAEVKAVLIEGSELPPIDQRN